MIEMSAEKLDEALHARENFDRIDLENIYPEIDWDEIQKIRILAGMQGSNGRPLANYERSLLSHKGELFVLFYDEDWEDFVVFDEDDENGNNPRTTFEKTESWEIKKILPEEAAGFLWDWKNEEYKKTILQK